MSEQKIVESIEQKDGSGEKWRIDITKSSMLLYSSEKEYPVVKVNTNDFEVFYTLRDLIKTYSTKEIWNFINFELKGPENKNTISDPPPGLMFFN